LSNVAVTKRPFHALFLFNAILVSIPSLLILFAYPALFARLGIASLDNGFFIRLSGAFLFVEAIASYRFWHTPARTLDLVRMIVAMKVAFILVVVGAAFTSSLPSTAFVIAAAVDLALSIVFVVYLIDSRDASA